MNKTKSLAALTFTLLGCLAGSAQAGVHVHIKCESTARGKCPTPPAPPVPPVPPAPPAPPAPPHLPHDGASHVAPPAPPALPALPAMPAMPAIPAPPAPPAPPPLPEVPASAHAACAGKADGARITHVPAKGVSMTGVCEIDDGKPVFQLREYRVER